ncbi:Acetylxylan esterase precursor [Brevundimonas sp. SH203]|uniref:alpha/beta hydrolase n=1 Tax=Brevundimonas sp. SH203 TaxID=345167 RepID=UPI0009CEFA47|nr:alpha/beta hydrolase [Brevundimonas sp. SH203]GAW40957.1 Acetylxylan esterase precursor [Brevundimonas sp. SH203]
MPSLFPRLGISALAALVLAFPVSAQTVAVWRGVAPGAENARQNEVVSRFPGGGFEVVRNVTRPTLEVFRPEPGTATGAAVVIAPGGGFRYLTIEAEGRAVARTLAQHGVTAFVLKYRTLETPVDDGAHWHQFFLFMAEAARSGGRLNLDEAAGPAVADGLQALNLVRERAAEWGVDRTKVGMIGFSAGARVTAGALLSPEPAARPAFGGLIYGAAFNDDPLPSHLPPVFLAVAGDDKLAEPTVLRFYQAAAEGGTRPELHVYADGGHGFGMNRQGKSSDFWIKDLLNWLEVQGLARPQD